MITRKFLFPGRPAPSVQSILTGLVETKRVHVRVVTIVETDDPVVAELLATLYGAEEQPTGSVAYVPVAVENKADAAIVLLGDQGKETIATRKAARHYNRKPRKMSGEMVECNTCHRQVLKENLCKSGECKPCRMKARKEAKSQGRELSHEMGSWTGEKPEFGNQERTADFLTKPKDVISLAGLKGKKVG